VAKASYGPQRSFTETTQLWSERIRLAITRALLAPANHCQDEWQETPAYAIFAAATLRPPTPLPWPDTEFPDGFGCIGTNRKAIHIAWDEPSASWSKPIKVGK